MHIVEIITGTAQIMQIPLMPSKLHALLILKRIGRLLPKWIVDVIRYLCSRTIRDQPRCPQMVEMKMTLLAAS